MFRLPAITPPNVPRPSQPQSSNQPHDCDTPTSSSRMPASTSRAEASAPPALQGWIARWAPYLRNHPDGRLQPLLSALIQDPPGHIRSTQLAAALQEAGAALEISQVYVAVRVACARPSAEELQWAQAHGEELRTKRESPVAGLATLLFQDRPTSLDPIRLTRALHEQQVSLSLRSIRKAIKLVEEQALGQQQPMVPGASVSLAPHTVQSAYGTRVATNQLEHWVASHARSLLKTQRPRQTLTSLLRSDPPAHLSPIGLACALDKMAGITMSLAMLNRVIAASTAPAPDHMQRWVKERKHCFLSLKRPYQVLTEELRRQLPPHVQGAALWRALRNENIAIGCSTVNAALREAKACIHASATATSTHAESPDNAPMNLSMPSLTTPHANPTESPLPEIPADALAWLENLDTSPMNLPMCPEPAISHPTQAGHSNS